MEAGADAVSILAVALTLGAALVVLVWGLRLPPVPARRFIIVGGAMLLVQALLRPLGVVVTSLSYRIDDPLAISAIANVFNVLVVMVEAAGVICLGWAARDAITRSVRVGGVRDAAVPGVDAPAQLPEQGTGRPDLR